MGRGDGQKRKEGGREGGRPVWGKGGEGRGEALGTRGEPALSRSEEELQPPLRKARTRVREWAAAAATAQSPLRSHCDGYQGASFSANQTALAHPPRPAANRLRHQSFN